MRCIVLVLVFTAVTTTAIGQYFQFSQINYSDQRINPAVVATSDYATLNLVHRNQKTGGDFNLKSSFISVGYPLLSKKDGRRWSGLGVSLLDDRSGGIFKTQEATLSYAMNVYLSRWQTLTLGAKGLYQQRRIDLDGLYTGMQYIPDRGFDEGASSGETFQQLQNSFFTLSLGAYWQAVDRKNNQVSYVSLAFFDFNKPNDSFLGMESQLKGAFVGAMGFRAYQNGPLTIVPEILYTHTYANDVMNLGAIWRYDVGPSNQHLLSRVDLITKYVIGRSGILGIQFHKDNFSVGFSYDFPVIIENAGNTGAFELGIQLRRLVDPGLKARAARKKATEKNKSVVTTKRAAIPDTTAKSSVERGQPAQPQQPSTLKESLKNKQDSIMAKAQAGNIRHEPVELEKATLRFNFDFNSAIINDASGNYLKELAEVLKENKYLHISLTGHTDNIGSDKFNLRLSKDRAQAVKDYLVDEGVEPERILVDGKGMREPLNDNLTEEHRALNRRVELRIVYQYKE